MNSFDVIQLEKKKEQNIPSMSSRLKSFFSTQSHILHFFQMIKLMVCKRLIKAAPDLLCDVYCHIEQYLQPALFISANCVAGELVFFL